ncbi:MAG: 6-bladed beta-propeller [Acidobacteriota bacterium]|nr:6-bladed beta-propeller [Acidobacteriota bacterium]
MALPVAAAKRHEPPAVPMPPDLLLEGNRKLSFEREFSSEKDTRGKPGFWTKVVDVIAGEPTYREMMRPYSVAVDSHGRVIVSDPGAQGVHIFDFAQHKYKFLERWNKDTNAMRSPQCVAVDASDNIYVTDSEAGKIFVWDAAGKFRRVIGSLRGGEGYFKRPTGIAVDSAAGRIYVTDTLRNKIFVLNMDGEVLQSLGEPGAKDDQLHFPTELRLNGKSLVVVDAMNFKVKRWSRASGTFEASFGEPGDSLGQMFRPKGLGVDSEGHYYVVEAARAMVQVFDQQGQLLYYFGRNGTGLGEFQLPAGLFIDANDRIYIVDSYNRRVQVFHYYGLPKQAGSAN